MPLCEQRTLLRNKKLIRQAISNKKHSQKVKVKYFYDNFLKVNFNRLDNITHTQTARRGILRLDSMFFYNIHFQNKS